MIFAPRSWPSSPGFAITTLIVCGTAPQYRDAPVPPLLVRPLTFRAAVRATSIVLPSVAIAVLGLLLFWPAPSAVRPADRIEHLPPDLFERPPLSHAITLATPRDAERRRARLRRFVFGRDSLPVRLPTVERDMDDAEFADDLPNIDRIDRLTIPLPLGFTSVAYHLIPRRANRRLLIYHNGHDQDFFDGERVVAHFLARGYALLVFAMPYEGLNTNPDTIETKCGRVELAPAGSRTAHESLACVPQPFRYFLEPVAVGLNHTSALGYTRTAMVGLSGGGWTTVVYAALDPRVQYSYPVAGSRPFHITARNCPGDTPDAVAPCFGDFEQRMPDFYRIANYLELYTLGAFGPGRRQLAINNVYDPCCFSGTSYEEWRPLVQTALRRLGAGEYDAIGDTTHRRHIVSPFALRTIEADLRRD
jgi:hypothetical protein